MKSSKLNKGQYAFANAVEDRNIIGPWQRCKILSETKTGFEVQFNERDAGVKEIPKYNLAFGTSPNIDDLLPGKRVIAKRCSDKISMQLEYKLLISRNESFYAGIAAPENHNDQKSISTRLIFFDDGHVEYVSIRNIRMVYDNCGHSFAHANAETYFEHLLNTDINISDMLTLEVNDKIVVECDGDWLNAVVIKVDRSLVRILFQKLFRYEWIYVGSPRIKKIQRKKTLDSFDSDAVISHDEHDDVIGPFPSFEDLEVPVQEIENTISIKSTDHQLSFEVNPNHLCSNKCVSNAESIDANEFGAFSRPLQCGWKRLKKSHVTYVSPCGKEFKVIKRIDEYLIRTKSSLLIDYFTFNLKMDCTKQYARDIFGFKMICDDISLGLEDLRVPVFGTTADKAILSQSQFQYIKKNNYTACVLPMKADPSRCCDCSDDCRDKSKCSCWQYTFNRQKSEKINTGYDYSRFQKVIPTGIFECNEHCKCSVLKCTNRVTQRPLSHNLEVFPTKNCGFGVRTLHDIPEAVFICCYVGDVLSDKKAYEFAKRNSNQYQFTLNPATDNDRMITKRRKVESINGEVNGVAQQQSNDDDTFIKYISYWPKKPHKLELFDPSTNEMNAKTDGYVIDSFHRGNVARFFNHDCVDPNLFVQMVYVESDERFPCIAFFTRTFIKAGKELRFNYNATNINPENRKKCKCRSNCKAYLF